MSMTNQVDRVKLVAGTACVGAACLLIAAPAMGQTTGVSRPNPEIITVSPSEDQQVPAPPVAPTKPSAAIPVNPGETVYGPYVPYKSAATAVSTAKAFDPDASIVTEETAGRDQRRLLAGPQDGEANPDAGIVTGVKTRAGEVPEGTLFKAKLRENLSTLTTQPGTKFTAEVIEPLMRDGKVIVPAGSLLEGRVTWVRGGKRIGGSAAMHLEPRTVILPDGGQYILHARVIDTDNWDNTRVDTEGTIMRKESGAKTLAAFSLAAGGPMAAGAVIGGLPGAVIGAGVGAGVGTVVWLKQDRQASLPKDLGLVFSLTESMSTTPLSTVPKLERSGE